MSSNIHIIGDSHSLTFEGAPNIKTHWCGAATAFNLWKKHKTIQQILNEIPSQDEILFCFGEIDARIHIYQATKQYDIDIIDYIINITAYIYVKYIDLLESTRKISVMAIPPQGLEDNDYGYEYYADREYRQYITSKLNLSIKELCTSLRIPFIDIWSVKWGELLKENENALWPENDFSKDKCHIRNEIAIEYLEQWLKENSK